MKEIRFVTEVKPLQFQDVELNQFFTDKSGHLCQKVAGGSSGVYVQIANHLGVPYCDLVEKVSPLQTISSIRPKVTKIEF